MAGILLYSGTHIKALNINLLNNFSGETLPFPHPHPCISCTDKHQEAIFGQALGPCFGLCRFHPSGSFSRSTSAEQLGSPGCSLLQLPVSSREAGVYYGGDSQSLCIITFLSINKIAGSVLNLIPCLLSKNSLNRKTCSSLSSCLSIHSLFFPSSIYIIISSHLLPTPFC